MDNKFGVDDFCFVEYIAPVSHASDQIIQIARIERAEEDAFDFSNR